MIQPLRLRRSAFLAVRRAQAAVMGFGDGDDVLDVRLPQAPVIPSRIGPVDPSAHRCGDLRFHRLRIAAVGARVRRASVFRRHDQATPSIFRGLGSGADRRRERAGGAGSCEKPETRTGPRRKALPCRCGAGRGAETGEGKACVTADPSSGRRGHEAPGLCPKDVAADHVNTLSVAGPQMREGRDPGSGGARIQEPHQPARKPQRVRTAPALPSGRPAAIAAAERSECRKQTADL